MGLPSFSGFLEPTINVFFFLIRPLLFVSWNDSWVLGGGESETQNINYKLDEITNTVYCFPWIKVTEFIPLDVRWK